MLRRIGVGALALGAVVALSGCMGDGVFVVGTAANQVPPGTYVSFGNKDCYWKRLSGFGGSTADIIANGIGDGRQIVTIEPSDAGFESHRCLAWNTFDKAANIRPDPSAPLPGEGMWRVGVEVTPGRWRSSPNTHDCYWTRLSGFHGTNVDETIADDISDGPVVVDIAPTDIGFSTKRCGTWTKVA